MMNNALPIYQAKDIRAWEQDWFDKGNSSFGLMCQAALLMAHQLVAHIPPTHRINVWCGVGNNGGDGLLLANYLHQMGMSVHVILPKPVISTDACRALDTLDKTIIITDVAHAPPAEVQVDAIFGIGLVRKLDDDYQQIIHAFNHSTGKKIAVDIPSGLHADTGVALPICTHVEMTLCLVSLKAGLFGSISKSVVGDIQLIPLIPTIPSIRPTAHLINKPPQLPPRPPTGHKGDFGSVMVIGGHALMGGAVIMAGESAMATGAGRVTILTHHRHHTAILARAPNLMLGDIEDDGCLATLQQMTAVCFGMGLGRDDWAKGIFERIFAQLLSQMAHRCVVLDADALWHLAHYPLSQPLPPMWILTPHSAEAGRLLGIEASEVENDRLNAIRQLQQRYGGQWVLKGANTLSLNAQGQLSVCTLGNAGMATAGMGDVLSGMMAGIMAQFEHADPMLAVALHAHAGDILAGDQMRGIHAHQMSHAIRQAVN